MEVQFGPNAVDEPNLLYKIQRKIKVFGTTDPLPNHGYNLVASSSKYGLVFVGVPSGSVSVYYLQQLVDKECEPQHMTIGLAEKPTYLSVSCDYELLAVSGIEKLYIYRIAEFQNGRLEPSLAISYDKYPHSYVTAMQWNPCIPDSIALALHDGTLIVCQVSTGQVKKIPSMARSICWSPKGKQLVTGNMDGTMHQFKPDLTPAKAIPLPKIFEGCQVAALAVYWISTFQFAVVYKNPTENRPSVMIVNTPKGGQPTCINYEDICYSMGSNRPWYYYLQGILPWNIILSASANSMELATIGSTDGTNWLQWSQPDEARPELPLTNMKQENYPVGVCIDLCAVHQLPWGENETLPHMPLLHVVSQSGLLTIFNVINLNKQSPQICSPPTPINLPTAAFTSDIPGVEAKPPEQPPAPETKPQPTPVAVPLSQSNQFASLPTSEPSILFGSVGANSQLVQPSFNAQAAPIKVPSFTPTAIPTPLPAQLEIKAEKPIATPLQVSVPPPKPLAIAPSEPPKAQPPPPAENPALKAEQERINQAKANQELKNMLVKEVNDFQNELYSFMVKTRETQARIQKDIESINANFNINSLDTEQLKKECLMDELRGAIVQLKLELVRACAVIAEARSHSNARELHQFTQADPLTTKRVSNIKKLAYYVQTQLDQAQKALDYKWSEVSKDNNNAPGKRMIRPILDDVYQPLVKQQEILSRQQAVLRTLRKTLSECDVGIVFKPTSLLRSTPFKIKDPLSKLTKNILNMSIEPQNPKTSKALLTNQKLDMLKDALTNRKMVVKIKPSSVEFRQHFISMKENYERILRDKLAETASLNEKAQNAKIMSQPEPPPPVTVTPVPVIQKMSYEVKQDPIKQAVPTPTFTPQISMTPAPAPLANVARTLFTDELKPEVPKSQPQPLIKPFGFNQAPATQNAKSVLKDLLQNKSITLAPATSQAQPPQDTNNFFMGQKICSPTGLARSSAPTAASPPTAVFTSKPISEMSNMFTKLPTSPMEQKTAFSQPFTTPVPFETKTPPKPVTDKTALNQETKPKIQNETGEPEPSESIRDKPKTMTNLFGLKPSSSSPSIPDVLKSSSVTITPVDKISENIKENVPKLDEAKAQVDKKEIKPFGAQTGNKIVFGFASVNSSVSVEPKDLKVVSTPTESITEKTEKPVASEAASSISTSKPSVLATTTPPKESTPPKPEDQPTESKSPAASLFGAAASSQPKSEASLTQGTSIFSSTNPPSVFGAKSVFGSNNITLGNTETTSVFTSVPSKTSDVSTTSTAKSETETTTVATTATAVFGSTVTPALSSTTVSSSSAFSTTPSSVFGQAAGAFAPTTTSLFPATTSATFGTSNFGTTSQASVFETATTPTASSVFGAANQAFGSTTPTKPTGSIFGSPTTQASVFGSTSPQSLFGTQTTQSSVFGTTTQTTQASIFGTPTTQASVFGTQSAQAPVFGTTPSTQASVFGSSTATTQASVFGSTTPSTQASVFGTATPTTQASVFGTPTPTTQASLFGTPTPTTQASVFGTPTQTTQASVFGTPTPTTQASVFGGSASTGSLFGGGEANLFASASISTTNAPTGTSGGNLFGASSGGSVFGGSGGNVFGSKSAFGQSNNASANVFGGNASFGQPKPAANLWAGGSNTSAFGSNTFGQATTQASSIFGGSSGGSFSAPSAGAFGSPQQTFGTGESQPASVFGSPQQSASAFGGSPVFGSKPAFGQPAGFGSPTNTGGGGFGGFGGGFSKSPSSGFGAPAAFGGGASFGGGAAFGSTSPGKVFGGAAPNFDSTTQQSNVAASFGSPTQQSNATFENLAGQNTLTFGSLAQSPQQQPQQSSFNTSPSFTGWRG